MNKGFFISFALLTLIVFSSVQYFFSTRILNSFTKVITQEVEQAFNSQVTVLSDLIRNDVLTSNFREARNKLGRATSNSRIVGCDAIPLDGSKESLIVAAGNLEGRLLEQVKVPLLFSSDGPPWGHLEFVVDTTSLSHSVSDLRSSLQRSQLFLFALLGSIFLLLHGFIWHSGRYLEQHLGRALVGLKARRGILLAKLWLPVLERVEAVAGQYSAVNLLIAEVEQDKIRGSKIVQVVHDLKSPLTALRLIIPKASFSKKDEEELVSSAMIRIEKLINSSLNAYKGIEPNSGTLEAVDLRSAVLEILPELRSLGSNSTVDVTWDENVSEYSALANRSEFQSVLCNMVKNSVEAALGRHVVVKIILKQTKAMNYLIVADNGNGISPSVIEKLGHVPTTSGKSEGSGQGLFNAFKLVRSWAGEIKISSVVQQGTQIVVAIPFTTKG